MKKLLSRRPSPALALAFVAMLAALSGTAIALPGKNSVQSNDIKKNAVTGSKIKKSAVASSDVKNDSLTGSDIKESTLGKVPSAGTADKAGTATTAGKAGTATTAGLSAETARLKRWSTAVFSKGGAVQVFSAGSVTLTAKCADVNGSTVLQYEAGGPATAFAEGAATDAVPGDLPAVINDDASSSVSVDILNAEDGGWQIGDGSLRVVGVLGGLVDPTAGTCQAWGFGTID